MQRRNQQRWGIALACLLAASSWALPAACAATPQEAVKALARALSIVDDDYRLTLRITTQTPDSFAVARVRILHTALANYDEYAFQIDHARTRTHFCLRCNAGFLVTACAAGKAEPPIRGALLPGTRLPWEEFVGNLCNAWELELTDPEAASPGQARIQIRPASTDWTDWDHSLADADLATGSPLLITRQDSAGSEVRRIRVLDFRRLGALSGISRALIETDEARVLVEVITFEIEPLENVFGPQ